MWQQPNLGNSHSVLVFLWPLWPEPSMMLPEAHRAMSVFQISEHHVYQVLHIRFYSSSFNWGWGQGVLSMCQKWWYIYLVGTPLHAFGQCCSDTRGLCQPGPRYWSLVETPVDLSLRVWRPEAFILAGLHVPRVSFFICLLVDWWWG
jgi:hypothetical protein